MTCAAVRQYLLQCLRPDEPGRDEAIHLAGCSACREWQARLIRLEQRLAQLPVPVCPPPLALLERLDARPVTPPPLPGPLVLSPLQGETRPRRRSEGGRQKLALAFSLAATLALFTLGWWAWPHRSDPVSVPRAPTDPWLARRDEVLRNSPQQRVVGLLGLAREVLAEAGRHAEEPEQVARLARHFEGLVQRDLLHYAHDLPADLRREVLRDVVKGLQLAESDASRLASEWESKYAASARSVERMAAAARLAVRALA